MITFMHMAAALTAPGSSSDKTPSENEQAQSHSHDPVNIESSKIPLESEDIENIQDSKEIKHVNHTSEDGNKKIQTASAEVNLEHMNSAGFDTSQTFNENEIDLDVEVKYNREVLGAETDTCLDDLLVSNKDNLNDETEKEIVPQCVRPVQVEIVKIDCSSVAGLHYFDGINSDIAVSVIRTKDDTVNDKSAVENGFLTNSKDSLKMPETRQDTEGSVSPSLMVAQCRYRWEKTIVTKSDSVVFVTLNNKEIEPIKLEWDESSKCFYSEEFKIPTGKYVGNLVIDGVFYPVEDVTVKHYTFEVDLYLKDGKRLMLFLSGLKVKKSRSQATSGTWTR